MNALYLTTPSGPAALTCGELPTPTPGSGELLIAVHATAVTPTEFDWFPTFHTPLGLPRPFPIVPGHEFSGVVAALGPRTTGFAIGDEVYGLNDWFANGALASFTVAPASAVARKPASLTHPQAAVVPISALTAWQALARGDVRTGQRVLIHGAAGGVGVFGVQFARQRGAHVIATGSADNLEFLRGLGAAEVIDYRTARFDESLREVDFVLDSVGGETLDRSWRVLRAGGRLVTIATSSASAADPRVRESFLLVEPSAAQLTSIAQLIDSGTCQVFVEATYPLVAAPAAYARARQGRMRGKIALAVAA